MKAFFLLLILSGTGWGRIMPCTRVYDYATDDELSVDLLNGLWLEGPMVLTYLLDSFYIVFPRASGYEFLQHLAFPAGPLWARAPARNTLKHQGGGRDHKLADARLNQRNTQEEVLSYSGDTGAVGAESLARVC